MSELPLLVFTMCTGLAAGGYVLSIVYALVTKEKDRSWVYDAICIVLLGIGLLGALFHLGHPERFLNALANPTSMITQEAYWAIPFGALMLVDALLLKFKKPGAPIVSIIAAIAACGLMTVTSIEYFTSYGIAPWPYLPTLLLFIIGDVALGATLSMAFFKGYRDRRCYVVSFLLVLLLVVTFVIEAVVFSSFGFAPLPFAIAAVLAAIAGGMICGSMLGKLSVSDKVFWAVFIVVCIALSIARFAFYAAV